MTKLAYELLDDERVLVSAVGHALSCRVSSSEARRFAWSLLADLDPAEADALGYQPPAIIVGTYARPEERSRRRGAWQRREVLEALRDGLDDCWKVSNRLGTSRAQASVQLNRVMHLGFAIKLSEGIPHKPAKWTISDAGLAHLEAWADELQEAA